MDLSLKQNKLPKGWVLAELRHVVEEPKKDIVDGPFGSNLKANEYTDSGIPVLKIQNIKANQFIDKNIKYIKDTKADELSRHSFTAGDLIITKLGDPLGLCCKVPERYSYGIIVADLIRIRPSTERVFDKYLIYAINGSFVQLQFKSITKGTTRPRVNLSIVRNIKIPYAPLPEQRCIVEKIEELFSELDNGVESLKKAREQLKTYRQAVLKYAFEGKLTREWREQHLSEGRPEPAEKLLERIKKEREAHYQKQVEEWKKACEQAERDCSKKTAKPREPKDLPPLTEKELAELPEIPDGWRWVKLFQFCKEITDGDHQPPPKSLSGIPFITISNIQNNQIDFSSTFYVNENYYSNLKNSRRPEKGDILYTVTGSYGIPVLIDFQQKFCFQRHIGLIRLFEIVSKKYVCYLLQSNIVYQQAKKVATGTAQKTVSLEGLRNFKVPFSSNAEQHQIVSEIETRLSVCDQLEQTIEDSLKKSEALRQSILKKAFEGELTREWRLAYPELISGENSAESLLSRIRAEKERLKGEGTKRRSGKIRKR
jgi:type I restriction enzyme S subunit